MPPLAIGQSSITFNVDTSLVSQALSNVDLNLGTFERRAAALETFLVRTSGRLAASEAYASGLARFRAGARAGRFGLAGRMEEAEQSAFGRIFDRRLRGISKNVTHLAAGMVVGQIISASGIGEGEGFAGAAQRVGTGAIIGAIHGGPAGAAAYALSATVMELVHGMAKLADESKRIADEVRKRREEIRDLARAQQDDIVKLREKFAEEFERFREQAKERGRRAMKETMLAYSPDLVLG